ncbi:hypothetical protein TNCV_2345021 [Trichonephila clavipes]|nr:hypothetical protein TNCV_2345021 [Trichonephila clavipes]
MIVSGGVNYDGGLLKQLTGSDGMNIISRRLRLWLGIRRVQCTGAGGRHPFWYRESRGASRPRQQPGQASGGILPKSNVRWLGDSEQRPRLSPGASGLPPRSGQGFPWLSKALGSRKYICQCRYNTLCSSEGQGDLWLRLLGSLLDFFGWLCHCRGSQHNL